MYLHMTGESFVQPASLTGKKKGLCDKGVDVFVRVHRPESSKLFTPKGSCNSVDRKSGGFRSGSITVKFSCKAMWEGAIILFIREYNQHHW